MDFGLNIRKLRREKSLTQEALGISLGVKKQMVSNYESGLYPFPQEKIPALANELGINPLELEQNFSDSKVNTDTKITSDAWAQKTVDSMQARINALEEDKKYLQSMLELVISGKGNFLKGNVSLFPFALNGNITPKLAA